MPRPRRHAFGPAHYRRLAAHGADRAAGPPREGPALLQGIIICGRCGNRMTLRYHTRGGKELPTYVCQRDGIANGHAPCTLIPGHTLDERISGFLISQLTPLAEAAGRRPYGSRQLRPPRPDYPVADLSRERIQRRPVLGGLIREYERAA